MINRNNRNDVTIIETIVPDGGWGWIIVLSSFIIHFIIDGITYSMGDIYLEPMLKNLQFSRAYVSAIFAFLESITLASAPISTVFTNTFGCRKVTIVGAILASLGFFLSQWWSNVYYYYLTIGIIGGIGCGLIYLPAIVSVGYYFEEKRSFAMGIAVCGSGLGTVAFPYILPWLMNRFFSNDYKYALLFESILIFTCILFGLLMIPLPIEPSEQRHLRYKLQSESKEEANKHILNNIDNENNQTNEQMNQHESVPFVKTCRENVVNEDASYIDHRRNTIVSFQNVPYIGLNNISINKSEHPWKSLTHLSSPSYRHSLLTIQNRSLYQGSLSRISLPNKFIDDYYSNDKTVQSRPTTTTTTTTTINDKDSIIINNQCEQLSESIIDSLLEQINLNLLKNASFTLFTISNFLSSLGFFVPYNFAHDLAKDSHVEENHRKFVIMAIGFSTCFGHVIIGYIADLKSVNRLILYNSTLIIAGLSTIIAPYSGSHILPHLIYASFFGFFSGGYVGLTSIITVDLVGIDKLSNGMGIILLFQGIATAIGTPAAGKTLTFIKLIQ
ncbi:unnamed protein product [Rotaria sp. Silwood1]|nr:unnamed protein product [Rotaria sp. Silwood1]